MAAPKAPAAAREHDLKAAFLFRFLPFVQWPDSAFPTTNSPIVVSILGRDPFGPALEATMGNETIDSHAIIVKRSEHIADLLPCHLLFVARDAEEPHPPALTQAQRDGVLLVGESPDFLDRGGIVNFFIDDNQVRFAICLEAAERAHIKLRSRLLRLAQMVDCAPGS